MQPLSRLVAVLSAWVAASASIAPSAQGARAAQPEEQRTSLAGQIEVARLLDLAAQRLKIAVDYDATTVRSAGAVTLRESELLSDQDLWALVNRVLVARGLTTVRTSNAYTVVKIAEAAGLAKPEPATQPGPVPGYRSVLIPARHQSPKFLADSTGKLISKVGGSVSALGDVLLISDLSPQVDRALEILKSIDVAGPGVTIEEVHLKNFAPAPFVTLLNQVTAKMELASGQKPPGDVLPGADNVLYVLSAPEHVALWRDLISQLDGREQVMTRTIQPRVFAVKEVAKLIEQAVKPAGAGAGGPAGSGIDERWKLVTDELTGSIIITATPAQHEQIKALVDRLDSAPAGSRRPVRSFVIRNRSVREIQSILDQLVRTGVLATDSSNAVGPSPGTTGVTSWPPPSASPSAPANPIPAPATAPNGSLPAAPVPPAQPRPEPEMMRGTQFDRHTPPELVLSADEGTNTLIAMGEPRLLSQIESLLQTLDVRQAQVMLEVLIVSLSDSQTLDLGVELEATGATDDVRTRIASLFGLGTRDSAGNRSAGDGLGLTGVVLNPGDFSIILRALQTLNKGRSLSMPRLLVTNNQQATLDSVLEQPFASTNASNTVTTTSFGGTKPAGTQITLKPQIAEGDHLLLDYNISLSAFVGAAANASLPPPRQENKVQSAASLPDGHTVVVGGIELNAEGKAVNQVPGLGQIPLLGELFKNRANTNSRSRFYVFIRANILRHGSFEDLKYLSEVATTQTGVDDGWPVVEPRVIR